MQRKNLKIQANNQERQRRLESFRAISDFNEAYNKIVEFIPEDQKVTLDSRPSDHGPVFLLERLTEANANSVSDVLPKSPPFLESESFFRRYWMLQMAQFDSWREGFLPHDTFWIWMRSNKLVYYNGSYWITAEAYQHGYQLCKALFSDCISDSSGWSPSAQNSRAAADQRNCINDFLAFVDTLFSDHQHSEPIAASSLEQTTLDVKSIAMAENAKNISPTYFEDDRST